MNNNPNRPLRRGAEQGGPDQARTTPQRSETDHPLKYLRAITHGPKFHWFGYHDKLQFDQAGRFALGMAVDFEHRNPGPDDSVKVGMIDLQDGDRWIELGESRAWCWQQGCHLQWRPGSGREILWNDRQGDRFAGIVLDVKTGKKRILPQPIDNLSPDGRWALGVDFARIHDFRAGYGYAGIGDPNREVSIPDDSGVYKVHLDTGEPRMLVSVAQSARTGPQHPQLKPGSKRYINHVQWSQSGQRFLFLERPCTRLMTAAADGSDLRVVMFDASHYTWRDDRHILVWTGDAYRLFEDKPMAQGKTLWESVNGHQTYLPDKDWVITDTYPDAKRNQSIYLYQISTARRTDLGSFRCPPEYRGDWRSDTHPRLSPDAKRVCFDSPHNGGRQIYLMELP